MAMKSAFYIEYAGNQVEDKAVIAQAKAIWTQQGNKMKDLTSLNLYVKPEENSVYYVFNDEISSSIRVGTSLCKISPTLYLETSSSSIS